MLYDNEFDVIWSKIIQPHIVAHAKDKGVKHKPLFLLKSLIRYRYNKYKDILVRTYMVLNTTYVDRHKIASCILKSVLMSNPLLIPLSAKVKFVFSKKKLFEILTDKKLSEAEQKKELNSLIFLNEYLATNIVVSILNSYIDSDDRPERKFKHKIIQPEPFPKDDSDYMLDICIGLHYSNIKHFDPILFANTLFLWEKYSCRKKQCDNLEIAYKDLLMKETDKSDEEIKIMVDNALYGSSNN